jgi:hypothetical protein
MDQTIGVVFIVAAIAIFAVWGWWYQKTKSTTTSTTANTKSVSTGSVGFNTTQLTANLGYIEVLSKIDSVIASPDAVKACDILADTLWQAAIIAWKTSQTAQSNVATEIIIKTAKITTVDGTVVEVPVQ